ncbi:hypothetical protein HOH87_07595 [bacterium]|jgi:lipid-A-disaccharide synthase|nr:hypothetical protein [bacterium]
MSILVIAGEMSSDHYGAELVKAIKKKSPNTRIAAIGGAKLQGVADDFLMETAYSHAVGITENWGKKDKKKQLLDTIHKFGKGRFVRKAIIIDYPHMNLAIAETLQALNISISTLITPNFWIWNDKRGGRKLASYSNEIVTIFESERKFYEGLGATNCHYFGHPLTLDLTPKYPKLPSKHEQKVIIFNPGTRETEIKRLFPQMCKIAKRLSTDQSIKCWVVCPNTRLRPIVEDLMKNHDDIIAVWDSETPWESRAHFVVNFAGTATLRTALLGIPQVIMGALSPISYLIVTYLLRFKFPFIGLPNIIMGSEVVPEYRQNDICPKKIANKILSIISSEDDYKAAQSQLKTLSDTLPANPDLYDQAATVFLR